MEIHPLIVALREYKKIDGSMSRLAHEFEVQLSNNITGYKKYWLGLLEDPSSWCHDTASPAQDIMYNIMKSKSHSPEVIKLFDSAIDALLSRELRDLIDSVERGHRLARLLKFNIDYRPQYGLKDVLSKIPDICEGALPFKTHSYIYINDMVISDGVVLSGDIGNFITQGYDGMKSTIDKDGCISIVEGN